MDMHFDGVIFQTHAAELYRRLAHPHPPFAVLDLRDEPDWAAGRIPGARRISPEALANVREIEKTAKRTLKKELE